MKPTIYQNVAGPIAPFFRRQSPLSNWYPCKFAVRGQVFNCVEQYMMYAKAMLFGDSATAAKIMATASPADQKALGRAVVPFDERAWAFAAPAFVREALLAKFSQNPECLEVLRGTGQALIVEASPSDHLWGCGLQEGNRDLTSLPPEMWPGKNQLGKLLTSLRNAFAEVAHKPHKEKTALI